MKSILLNDQGDFEIDSLNNFKMIESTDEIKQRLKISLITEAKEWFLNLDFGVPWLQKLGDGELPAEFRKEVLKVLNDEPAVTKINSVETYFDRANRKLEIDSEVEIEGGTIAESVVIE